MVPIVSPIAFAIAPPVSESKLELKAHAQALVPVREINNSTTIKRKNNDSILN